MPFTTTTIAVCVVVGLVLVAVVCCCCTEGFHTDLVNVTSTVDQRQYLVRDMPDKQGAADLLARARQKLIVLCDKLEKHYPHDKRVAMLVNRFNADAMSELSAHADPKYTSYSISKGKKIIFCLRARDKTQKLITLQTLMFVAIHELAHVMTMSIGHTEEFWDNMRFLLANGIEWKLYRPVDYSAKPEPYCGLQITSSPLAMGTAARKKYVTYEMGDVVAAEEGVSEVGVW